MTDRKHTRHAGDIFAAEIIEGAVAALAYTDKEILETLPPCEANEFIELRNKVMTGINAEKEEYSIGYQEGIYHLPLKMTRNTNKDINVSSI